MQNRIQIGGFGTVRVKELSTGHIILCSSQFAKSFFLSTFKGSTKCDVLYIFRQISVLLDSFIKMGSLFLK